MAWYHSSSSSSTHHYVESYNYEPHPYFDHDDGDVDPSMVEEHWPLDNDDDYPYYGPGVEEDVKPTQTHPPGGGEGGAVAGHFVHDDYDYDDGDVEPSMVEHYPLDDDDYPYDGPGVEEDVKLAAKKQTRPPRGAGGGGAVAGRRLHDYDDDAAATVWYHSSSSTTHHYVTSYKYEPLPYFDGDGDVKPPSMVEQWRLDDDDYLYEGSGMVEDVKKPAKKKKQPARLAPEAKKKRKAPAAAASAASGDGGAALRSELKAKERALAQAKGKIGKLERELDKAKKRELAEARQALAFERQLGTRVLKAEGGGKVSAGGGKRRRGA